MIEATKDKTVEDDYGDEDDEGEGNEDEEED